MGLRFALTINFFHHYKLEAGFYLLVQIPEFRAVEYHNVAYRVNPFVHPARFKPGRMRRKQWVHARGRNVKNPMQTGIARGFLQIVF